MNFELTNPLPYGLSEKSHEADFWPTPRYVVDALIEHSPPPRAGTILEPAAGNGAIVSTLIEHGYRVEAWEIRGEEREGLSAMCPTRIQDFLANAWRWKGGPIVTNPPFSLMLEFAACALGTGVDYVAMLMPLSFLASQKRAKFIRRHPPTALRIISNRPSFCDSGRNGTQDVAWFIWDSSEPAMDIKPV